VTVLKEEMWMRAQEAEGLLEEMKERLSKVNQKKWDEEVKRVVANNWSEWKTENGKVYRGTQMYVPKDEVLREGIIEAHHWWGHPGTDKQVEQMLRNYWWPGMRQDVKRYGQACTTCQRAKPNRTKRAAPLQPNETPSAPWKVVSIDLVGPLPASKGYDMVLTVVDRMTKKTFFIPTTKEVTAKGIACLYRDHVF
jgi:hypothetical protein